MSKQFTLREAQSLLPQVEKLLQQAMDLKREYDSASNAQNKLKERVHMMGGTLVNGRTAVETRARQEASSKLLKKSLEDILELGVQIKDLDAGLIDFPTRFRGREVYLCWKMGETDIEFWHGEEGFRGRKAIDQDFLDHHGE